MSELLNIICIRFASYSDSDSESMLTQSISKLPPMLDMEEQQRVDKEHVADIPDGAGCYEIWEALTEQRDAEQRAD
jgi:hypothetical protein